MEKHSGLRGVLYYEKKYVNEWGYWMAYEETALYLHAEAILNDKGDEKLQLDAWEGVSIRYGLRVVGLRAEFYRMGAKDYSYAKLVMQIIEKRNEVDAANNLQKSMKRLETHLSTQLMKVVAIFRASNETKRADRGGDIGGKFSSRLVCGPILKREKWFC